MNLRSLLATLFLFSASGLLIGQEAARTTRITLRAFFDMIEEPAAVAEGFARWTGTRAVREKPPEDMRIMIPSRVLAKWVQIVDALQVGAPQVEKVEVFPPAIREAVNEDKEWPIKRDLLRPALAQIRELATKKAAPGENPELRTLEVTTAWLDDYWRVRDEFARKMSDEFVNAMKGEEITVWNQNGTFVRGSAGNLIKVAFSGVPEEGPVFCGPFGKNRTWNLYQVVNRPSTWLLADKAAREMTAPLGERKLAGHLVSIHSEAENQFVLRLMEGIPHAWIGLNDRRLEASSDKAGTWEWSSGELVTYYKWSPPEPNNANTPHNGGDEDGVIMDSDNQKFPGRAGVWTDFSDGARTGFAQRRPFIVEWSVEAKGPIAGAESLPGFFEEALPGPRGAEGTFGIRVVYGGGVCESLEAARKAYLSDEGWAIDAQIRMLHHRDPDEPTPGVLFPAAHPFPGQKEKVPDHDFAFLCRGRIRVPEAGVYTFGVVHDDGFALRIKGHHWRTASGTGTINAGDTTTLEHRWTAHQGCTLATIELSAGDHDLEMFGFQRQGGGYFQLFSAKGNFASVEETRDWRIVGRRGKGEVGIPGIAAPGWDVEVTPPGKVTRHSFDGVQRALERHGRKLEPPVGAVDFTDPDQGADLRLGGSKPFPEGVPKKNDNDFGIRARGLLEIPRRGTYWLGFQTTRGGRLTIPGQKWKALLLATPGKAVIDEDLIESEPNAEAGCRVVGEIELDAGKYPIEFLGCFNHGPAAVEVSATHFNGPDVHLKVGDARVMEEIPGLELVK